uniref:Flavin-containing monooxygenase n=2 Tax=Kalanchoe fedtschenkoi TaxID=63787 RepID=A0A7N0SZX8_KALFE
MERKVAIVGAGLSGLIACKYVLSKGYKPIVFESKSKLGGVWTKTVETTKLQSEKDSYQFSDFPWPESLETVHPDKDQVLAYIESYAQHFDLARHIRFSTKVVSIAYDGADEEEMNAWSMWGGTGEGFSNKGKWNINAENTSTSASEVHRVDFLILCLGRFSEVPNIPDFPPNKGPEVFQGQVIHAKDYIDMDYDKAANFVKGKRVTIVGSMKFAMDIAAECSAVNGKDNPCTMLRRTCHWILPDLRPWGVPFALLYFNRFSELLLRKPGQGFLHNILSTALSPVSWSISKFVESYVKWKLPLAKYGLVPEHSFLDDISSCTFAIWPDNFFDRVDSGSIVLKKADGFGFCKQGVTLNGELEPVKSDLVILATGFNGEQKLREIFASPRLQGLITGSASSIVPLYRQCVHPRIPQLAVIGFSESASNLFTSEMRSKWVAELLDGSFSLPSVAEMEKDIREWDGYIKGYSGSNYRRSCIAALHIWYSDQLCKDMGLNPKRKNGFLAELFQPYGPLDYQPKNSKSQ